MERTKRGEIECFNFIFFGLPLFSLKKMMLMKQDIHRIGMDIQRSLNQEIILGGDVFVVTGYRKHEGTIKTRHTNGRMIGLSFIYFTINNTYTSEERLLSGPITMIIEKNNYIGKCVISWKKLQRSNKQTVKVFGKNIIIDDNKYEWFRCSKGIIDSTQGNMPKDDKKSIALYSCEKDDKIFYIQFLNNTFTCFEQISGIHYNAKTGKQVQIGINALFTRMVVFIYFLICSFILVKSTEFFHLSEIYDPVITYIIILVILGRIFYIMIRAERYFLYKHTYTKGERYFLLLLLGIGIFGPVFYLYFFHNINV